jgi:hypothetical protein
MSEGTGANIEVAKHLSEHKHPTERTGREPQCGSREARLQRAVCSCWAGLFEVPSV